MVNIDDGCFDLDPTGLRVVVADGPFDCTSPDGDLVGPLLGIIIGDAEGIVSSLGDGVMDGLTGTIGLKTVGAGTGTISPFSQIDSGIDCMRLTFNPATASLSFSIGIRSPPTFPARTGTCDSSVGVTTPFVINVIPELFRILFFLRFLFLRSSRFRCAASESVPK